MLFCLPKNVLSGHRPGTLCIMFEIGKAGISIDHRSTWRRCRMLYLYNIGFHSGRYVDSKTIFFSWTSLAEIKQDARQPHIGENVKDIFFNSTKMFAQPRGRVSMSRSGHFWQWFQLLVHNRLNVIENLPVNKALLRNKTIGLS